jgi:hypothetical protein
MINECKYKIANKEVNDTRGKSAVPTMMQGFSTVQSTPPLKKQKTNGIETTGADRRNSKTRLLPLRVAADRRVPSACEQRRKIPRFPIQIRLRTGIRIAALSSRIGLSNKKQNTLTRSL